MNLAKTKNSFFIGLYLALVVIIHITNCDDAQHIRLVGGKHPFEGRIEFFIDGEWFSVCNQRWDIYDANVACKQLGHRPFAFAAILSTDSIISNVSVYQQSFECNGYEAGLTSCPKMANQNCSDTSSGGVKCFEGDEPAAEGSLRLMHFNETTLLHEGRVEIYHEGQWGTVCDNKWDSENTRVVCSQLGYNQPWYYNGGAWLGVGTGPILLDKVDCTGTEDSLLYCRSSGWYNNNCSHRADISVGCAEPSFASVRLANGSDPYHGRIELYTNDSWRSISGKSFGWEEALVACYQLGYGRKVKKLLLSEPAYGAGMVKPYHRFDCYGTESSLDRCRVGTTDWVQEDGIASLYCVIPYAADGLSDGAMYTLGIACFIALLCMIFGFRYCFIQQLCNHDWNDPRTASPPAPISEITIQSFNSQSRQPSAATNDPNINTGVTFVTSSGLSAPGLSEPPPYTDVTYSVHGDVIDENYFISSDTVPILSAD